MPYRRQYTDTRRASSRRVFDPERNTPPISDSAAHRYLRLGLQLRRHVDGIVDAYYGPPELVAEVDAEPPVEPAVRPHRGGRVRGRSRGARGTASGKGRWPSGLRGGKPRCACPSSRSSAPRRRSSSAPRAWTCGLIELPDGEGVELEIVRDVPWMAFCEYLGHHAERCAKEQLLVRDHGLIEESLVMVPTPQMLVSEGIAGLAPWILVESDGANVLRVIARETGIDVDLTHALAVGRAHEPCRWAEVNAALMLYETGASQAETQAYLERWGLMTTELAAHLLRFFGEETSQTYIVTYPAGQALCRSYVAGDPARLRRLLTEQVRVRDLLEAGDARPATPAGVRST